MQQVNSVRSSFAKQDILIYVFFSFHFMPQYIFAHSAKEVLQTKHISHISFVN